MNTRTHAAEAAAAIHRLLMSTIIGRRPSKALEQEVRGIRMAAEAVAHGLKWDLPEAERAPFVAKFLQDCGLYA